VLVVAALSGGVDSATAAARLVAEGHRVVGMTMRLYDARGTIAGAGRCCGPRDVEDARAVCRHLGIPFYVIDLEAEFTKAVVDDFVEAYLAGETPNPCVKCNQHIKFTPLLERARAIGADVLVTGHYARIEEDGAGGWGLYRGADAGKDQSYFLFAMPGNELASVRFPLGGMDKDAVRAAVDDKWGGEITKMAEKFEARAKAYNLITDAERLVPVALAGTRFVSYPWGGRYAVDRDAAKTYESAILDSTAHDRSTAASRMFDDLMKEADHINAPLFDEHTAAYPLVALVPQANLELGMDVRADVTSSFWVKRERYLKAGFVSTSAAAKGAEVSTIRAGMFDLDAIISGN
jgi:hypothetical protein